MDNLTAERSAVQIINTNTPRPEIIGLPAGEEKVFFGKIFDGAYCAITAARAKKDAFKEKSVAFGETENVKAKIYYFRDSTVDCRPVICGAKDNDLWFCRTHEEKNIFSGYIPLALSYRAGVHRFNGMEFEKVFQTF